MAFTAKDVSLLREKTGVGMMDCKRALTDAGGDMEKAIELLREKGLAAAAKKSGRIAAEGIVHAIADNNIGVVVEVNAETDFVAKNAEFVAFVDAVAKTIAAQSPADVDALSAMKLEGSNMTVDEALKDKILVIGENMKIRRFERYEGIVAVYIHGGGRIGVMVGLDSDVAAKDGFDVFAKDIAMQIAAAHPQFVSREEISDEIIAKEKEILTAQAMNEGKPREIAEKMVTGRLGKYFKDVCLLEQPFVKDPDVSVKQHVENTGKALGGSVAVTKFVRFEKGEGIEKKEENFADEVAGMMNK